MAVWQGNDEALCNCQPKRCAVMCGSRPLQLPPQEKLQLSMAAVFCAVCCTPTLLTAQQLSTSNARCSLLAAQNTKES